MVEVVLGIDVGTSGVRVVARDRAGGLRALNAAKMAAPLLVGKNLRQDPHIWWAAVEQALLTLDLSGLRVRALAIDATSGTLLAVDAAGTPLSLGSMYNDVAAVSHVRRIAETAPAETAVHGATSPLARAFDLSPGAHRILHQADWVMGRFAGHFAFSDENNALKSGYDPVARRWPDWIEHLGFDRGLFPEVLPVGRAIGPIAAPVADHFKLPRDVVVVTGTTDGCAAFLASGAAKPGDGVTSLGTTLTLKLLSATPVFAPQYGIYSHRMGDQWLAGGASNSGGAVLAAYFSDAEIESLSALIDPTKVTGLSYYPLVKAGERFPVNDPALPPQLEPRPQRPEIFLQAMLEGIATIEALGYQRLSELGANNLTTVRSVGSGAANEVWTHIRLAELKVPALPSLSDQAAMGAARLAWWGIGHEA